MDSLIGSLISAFFSGDRKIAAILSEIWGPAHPLKQKAELDATSAKYTRSQYYDMRLVTRTEADMPEGMLGYDADEVVRKANAAKDEKEAGAI